MGLFSGPTRREPEQPQQRSGFNGYAPIGVNYSALANPQNATLVASQSVAIRSAVDLICSIMSELPVHVYSGDDPQARRRIKMPRNLEDPGGDGYGLRHWIYQAGASWLYRGNLYGTEIEWQRNGQPSRIALHHPDDVSLTTRNGRPTWLLNGRPVGNPATFVHIPMNPVPARTLGMSPIEEHAVTISAGLAASRFGAQFLQDGTHPQALLQNTESDINSEQAKVVLDRWRAMKSGTREPAVVGRGWEFKPLTITPNESQFLETMQFTEAQCARIFGPGIAELLGYETGGSMTYANVVDRRADALALSIDKWLNRADDLLSMLLPRPQYVEIDRDALLRSATLQRYQAHAIALSNGFRTVNEVRADENYPPVEWGDGPPRATGSVTTGGQPA